MRVLLVSTYSPFAVGGIGQFVHDYGIALNQRGISVTAIYRFEPPEFKPGDQFLESVRAVEVRPWDISGLRTYSLNWKTAKWVRHHRNEFDVFHVLNPMPMSAAALQSGHRFGIPCVVTIYAKYPVSPKRILRKVNERAESILLKGAEALVFESENTQKEFPTHRGRVVLNGIDTGYYRPQAEVRDKFRRSLGIDLRTPVVLFLGRMDRLKGIYLFLDAIASLRHRRSFYVLMVGSVEAEDIPERIRQLGIGDIVRVVGPVGKRAVLDYYCGSDVFVLPSYLEGISSALIEAMACGLPVVASRAGGNVEVVRDGIDGILVPPGDAVSLAEGIEALVSNPGMCLKMGTEARARIQDRFGLEAMTDRYISIYEEVLGGKAPKDSKA